MSDYMFMLESHLNTDQNRVVAELQAAALAANCKLFLAGGAMRDMLGGFPLRDLDFTVDGNALKLARTVADRLGGEIVEQDDNRKHAELRLPGKLTASISMSRQERYTKPGTKPQVKPGTIQDDLRCRDFTINAIALSLNTGSRGLLLDPMNGLADLERRELRAVSSLAFYEQPVRMLRLLRFKQRLGFTIDPRTQSQYENARLETMEQYLTARELYGELRKIAEEPNAAEIVRELEENKLLSLFLPALNGVKVSMASLQKLEKIARTLPPEHESGRLAPFLHALTEKLTPKEQAAFIKRMEMPKKDAELWQKLEPRSKKLETALRSDRIKKASQVYQIVFKAEPDEVLFLLYHSQLKPVLERIRNYFQKYLPMSQEFPQSDLAAKVVAKPGTPKYAKEFETRMAEFLDRRPKKVPPPSLEPPPAPPNPGRGRPRGSTSAAANLNR